jgi:hypothetical protein
MPLAGDLSNLPVAGDKGEFGRIFQLANAADEEIIGRLPGGGKDNANAAGREACGTAARHPTVEDDRHAPFAAGSGPASQAKDKSGFIIGIVEGYAFHAGDQVVAVNQVMHGR